MDRTTARLARYVAKASFDELSPAAVDAALRCVVDSIGCAIGAFHGEPVRIARELAKVSRGDPCARILGTNEATSMEMAAFANGAMIRYLDCNDTFISQGAGHPSDMLSAVLAVADATRSTGRDFLCAVVVAYEIFGTLARIVPIRSRGWDQGVFVVLGSAAAAAKLLGLPESRIGEALAIAVTANVPTRQTRSGELSMWKGCATAASAKAGVFAAQLAQRGMTGPTAAFEGRHGVWEQVTGRFDLPAMPGNPFAVEASSLKFFASEYHSQAPLWLALELRERLRVADIDSIHIATYHTAYSEIGSEPEKWLPRTRETADHSLPYLFAIALRDGRLDEDSFSDRNLADPGLAALMQRISVAERPAFTERYPDALISEIAVTLRDGRRIVERIDHPKGHTRNPMTRDEVAMKFASLCAPVLRSHRELLETLWRIPSLPDLSALFRGSVIDGGESPS